MMTEAEASAARAGADALLRAIEALKNLRWQLSTVNMRVKAGSAWEIQLLIDKDLPYGVRELTYKIPLAHVQQHLVDRVRQAERDVVRLGGAA